MLKKGRNIPAPVFFKGDVVSIMDTGREAEIKNNPSYVEDVWVYEIIFNKDSYSRNQGYKEAIMPEHLLEIV